MCGIAGIISHNQQLISTQKIEAAATCLKHRGPEKESFWINGQNTVAFGHRRLSIIDLSEDAGQPMKCLNRYYIIHNGELYNYIELRQQLQQKGHIFFTQSDTEVIAMAYATYGAACLQQFDGAFAFAIWDEQEQELFAARDRFGEKPFFFFYDEEQLVFASEIKALWSMGISKEVNLSMLYNFIAIDYTTNPADPQETFYSNIYKLPAASFLTYALQKKEVLIQKYWQVYTEVDHTISEQIAVEKFNYLFSDSIKKRLRSDVAIGTSLSGGLDSSAVVAFCDKEQSNQYTHKCFTASFKNFEKDELQFSQLVARQFNLEHYLSTIETTDVVAIMNKVMEQQEEPIASASPLAQYKVYELAKENGVTVLLDGQGADEILGGYHKYYKWYWQELYRQKKLNKTGETSAAQTLGIKESFKIKNKMAALFPEFTASLLQSRKTKNAFKNPDLEKGFAFSNKQNLYYSTPATFNLNGALYFNTFITGLEELLRLADRNSMAHAVEVRLPFLSHQLVEFLFTLPPNFKIHDGWTKWLLRKATDEMLPAEIVWRKDKIGFEPPQKQWMQAKEVQQAIMAAKEVLVQNCVLNKTVLNKKIKPHAAHVADNKDWKYWSAAHLFK